MQIEMDIDVYSEIIKEFCNLNGITKPDQLFCNGLQEEIDELQELIDEDDYAKEDLESELGDILWYVVSIANHHNISMNDIMMKNYIKLEKRALTGHIPNVLKKT